MKIKFSVYAIKWFDKINGNTYHSVQITDNNTGKRYYGQFQYGYGDSYRQTALIVLLEAGLLPKHYNKDNIYAYERENEYPILWNVSKGLKRDCIANGKVK